MLVKKQPNRWAILVIGGLFFLYEFFQINMFNALETPLMLAFGISAGALAKLSAAYFYGTTLLLFPAGLIVDRISTRRILLFAMTMTLLGTLFLSLAQSIQMAALGRFLVGLCAGPFALISVIKLATRWFSPRELSFATGIAIAIGMLGGILAQTPFHLLIEAVGWRAGLQVNVAIGAVMLLLIYAYVQDKPAGYVERCPAHNLPFIQRLRLVVTDAHNWGFGLYAALVNLPIFLLGSLFSNLYLTQHHGISALQASSAASMLFLGVLIGSPLWGWVSLRCQNRRYPMILGALLAFSCISILMFSSPLSVSTIITLFFLLGLGASAHTLAYACIAESNSDSLNGSATGLAAVLIMGGGAIFQPLFGYLLDSRWDGTLIDGLPLYSSESFLVAVSIIPVTLFLGLLLAVFSKETFSTSAA